MRLAAHTAPATMLTDPPADHRVSTRTEAEQFIPDSTGDVADPHGDIDDAFVEMNASGRTTVAVETVAFQSPFSADWVQGETVVSWKLTTAGDDTQAYFVDLFNLDGLLYGVVENGDSGLICDSDGVFWSAVTRSYQVAFATSCLGNPTQVTWQAGMLHESVSDGTTTKDVVPDGGVAGPVTNDAFEPVASCVPTVPGATIGALSPELVAVSPVRLLDTRVDGDTADCKAARVGWRGAGSVTALVVAGRGTPADAIAASLNVTVTDAHGAGFITVFPCDTDRVDGSNLNYQTGSTVANAVIAKIGLEGTVCMFTYAPVQLIVDVDGWVPPTSDYVPTSPSRLVDTRLLDTLTAPDLGLVHADSVVAVQVGGRDGVPAGAAAAVVNITAADTRTSGVVSAVPCAQFAINSSTLNFVAHQDVPNLAIVQLDASGKFCLRTSGATHLIVDLDGWFPHTTTYMPITPARLLETRTAPGLGTVDGQAAGIGLRSAGETTAIKVSGRAGVPTNVDAVILNITVDDAQGPGYVTVFPCGTPRPNASTLNYTRGATIANAAITRPGPDATVCLFTYGATHLVADITGYIASPGTTRTT
ncbi:MAG: hypothetical protein ABIR68_13250 [Ilumatobacteraceae bacterium]